MRCETYSRWMTAAALGNLPAAQQSELCAHASLCASCSVQLAAARDLVGGMERSVAALVSGEPSPAFTSRLRARIAAEPAPSRWPVAPRLAFAGAALVAAAFFALLLVRGTRQEIAPPANFSAGAQPAAPILPVVPPPSPAPRSPRAQTGSVAAHGPREHRDSLWGFQVLVPRGQLAAALELNDAVNAGRVDGEQLVALAEHAAMPLEWKRMEIAPLEGSKPEPAGQSASPDGALRF